MSEKSDFPALAPEEVSSRAKFLHEILTSSPAQELDAALTATRIQPEPKIVQEVLKLCYGKPALAVKFFRWSGLIRKHAEYSWDLMVDLLGKEKMFEPMWDAIRSMKQEGVLSLRTFVSVFDSYCVAGKFSEAIMTFDVMDRYGIQPNITAVNSLLSAFCREDNQTAKAIEFFERIKTTIAPDADSFAILLEGWEKEGNVAKAKNTFGEMVIRVGWSPQYMCAYDAFLNTLVRGSHADEAVKFLRVMKGKHCLPSLKFLSNALDVLVKQNDSTNALLLWDMMVDSGLIPNLIMYNAMIGLLCNSNDVDNAFRLLDEMVFHGSFPDSLTYNLIFQCLIKNKKVRGVGKFFREMIKNEWPPTQSNYTAAITMLFDGDDPLMALEIWEYMVINRALPLDDSGNAVLIGLCKMGRMSELRRYTEKMLDKRIILYESTMEKLKKAFYKEGRNSRDIYDHLFRKWKSC